MIKILLACLVCTSVFATPLDLEVLRVRSGIHFDYVEGQDIDSRLFGYRFRIDAEDEVTDDISMFFSASAILETGSNEVVASQTEFAPLETVVLNSGGIKYEPFDFVILKIGALSPREYNSPLLMTSAPVVGSQQILDLGFLYIKSLQAIPNNNRLARRVGTLENGTPALFVHTLGLKYKEYLKLEASRFSYQDLAPNIAIDSRQFGNSTNQAGGEAERFLYACNGVNVMVDSKLPLGAFALGVYGQYIFNEDAPEERNEGYRAGARFFYKSIGIEGEAFKNESDTSPGFYNSKYYGHNNIEGQAIGIFRETKVDQFNLKYYHFEPIEDNAIQFETDIVTFNWSLKYDL